VTYIRSGRYEYPLNIGYAYVGGFVWSNIIIIVAASSEFAGMNGKVGTWSDLQEGPSGGRDSYNEVTHHKRVWSAPLIDVSCTHKSKFYSLDLKIDSTGAASCGPDRLEYIIGNGSFSESADVALLRATSKMEFNVQDAGFNLPIFLGELRDFRHALSAFQKTLSPKTDWSDVGRWVDSRIVRAVDKPVTFYAKLIAGANLFNNFAVQPFLADIEAIMGMHQHILRQIDRLRSVKPVRVRAAHVSYLSPYELDATNPAAYTRHTWKGNVTGVRTVRTWARVQYNWGALAGPPSASSLLVDAMGVDKPLSIAWELTPWSFLWDYFMDIGSFIGQFEDDTFKVPFTILADGYSVKTEKRADVTCFIDKGNYNAPWQNHKSSTVNGSLMDIVYIRRKGPLSYGTLVWPELRLPNIKQVGNILSLIIANLRGR